MKLPRIFRWRSSIAIRLTWRVVGTMLLIFTLVSSLVVIMVWAIGMALLSGLFWTAMNVSNEKINSAFSVVETAVSNNSTEVLENIGVQGHEFYATEQILQLNPSIIGAAVALNPEYEPLKGQRFAAYSYRDSSGIKSKMLNSEAYDYLHKEWYTVPIDSAKGVWSEPYVDEGGGDMMMITYSMPLTNSKKETFAVQTADISIDRIARMAQELDSMNNKDFYPWNDLEGRLHTRSFIVTKKGTFVVNPDKKTDMKETIYDFFKRTPPPTDDVIADRILSGKKSMAIVEDETGKLMMVSYSPLQRQGWSMGIILPLSDILQPVNFFAKLLGIIILVGILIVALVCSRAIHRITKPLSRFADSADEIAKGNIQAELPVIKTKDEMLRLHDSFATMQKSLARQIEQIKTVNEEKGRMEGELLIARNIQMAMIPKKYPAFPDRTDIDVFAQMTPAKEVGGDLYDYHIRDEKLFFCIGDVSGKGIPASLVMAVTRALFRSFSAHESNPGKIVGGINNQLAKDNESDMFVTLFVGVLDLPTGRLRYSNAGHNAPMLVGKSGIEVLTCDSNLPVGIITGQKFSTQEMVVTPHTTIFLYTDGLTEAENACHMQFLEERVSEVARMAGQQPQMLIRQMMNEVNDFVGDAEQSDDLTMLAIEYAKQNSQEQDEQFQRSITLTNNVEEVPKMAEFVEGVCEEAGIDMGTTMSLNLAIEEAVVNVMSYAYPTNTVGDVVIKAIACNQQVRFIIIDSGKPFDPTTMDDIDTTLPAEDRDIGGLGIHLVRQIMDSINYERIDGKNVLTLTKKIESQ
ncbi:MAG: SpoIIE family protein phosphatase [Prevotella sp.]|nr:SpoIIE family protein phosphatase [Prevotella sp.]